MSRGAVATDRDCQDVPHMQLPARLPLSIDSYIETTHFTTPEAVTSTLIQHGANQGPQRSRALPCSQQVRDFSTSSIGLDRASHQCAQHIRIRRTPTDAKHPEPTEFRGACVVSYLTRDLRLGNLGRLQGCVDHTIAIKLYTDSAKLKQIFLNSQHSNIRSSCYSRYCRSHTHTPPSPTNIS